MPNDTLYNKALNDGNMHSAVSKFRPLLTTAEQSNLESSNQMRPRANARESISSAAYGGMALEDKPGEAEKSRQAERRPQDVLTDDLQYISLPLVQDACPKIAAYIPNAFDSWAALRETGRDLCAAIGINPQVWQEALGVLGPDMAIAALAVTIQKFEVGLVAKPGAYLRTMIQRGREGELHVSRSLFGMAQAARGAEGTARPAAVAEIVSFPTSGSVVFSTWASVIRENSPKPTPDLDLVAEAFRRWTRERNIDLSSPNIERVLVGFCKKWRLN